MDPRLVDPEVEKDLREQSREERDVLSDPISRLVPVRLYGCAEAGVLVPEERLRESGEVGPRGAALECLEMRATQIERLGLALNDIQARHAALGVEHAKPRRRDKALKADLANLRNV